MPENNDNTIRDRLTKSFEGFNENMKKGFESLEITIRKASKEDEDSVVAPRFRSLDNTPKNKGVDEYKSLIETIKSIDPEGRIKNEIAGGFRTATQSLTQGVMNVLGPEMNAMVETIKGIGSGMWSMVTGLFGLLSTKNPPRGTPEWHTIKQTDVLESMKDKMDDQFDLEEKARKDDLKRKSRERKKEKNGMFPFLLPIIGILKLLGIAMVAALSPIILQFGVFKKAFVDPFIWLTKWLANTKFAVYVKTFVSKMGSFGKILGKMGSVIGKIGRGFAKLVGFLGKAGTRLLGLTKVIPVIGWFVMAIMGVIDFFRGFRNAQGGFLEKIKAGLIEAFIGVVELPIKFFGWLTDKLLGVFGIEIEGGSASKVIEGTRWALGFVFDMIIGTFKMLGNSIKWLISSLDRMGQWIKTTTVRLFEEFKNLLLTVFSIPGKIFDWFKSILPTWEDIKGWFGLDDENMTLIEKIKSVLSTIMNIPNKIVEWLMGVIPSWEDIKEMLPSGKDILNKFNPWGKDDEEKEKEKLEEERRKQRIKDAKGNETLKDGKPHVWTGKKWIPKENPETYEKKGNEWVKKKPEKTYKSYDEGVDFLNKATNNEKATPSAIDRERKKKEMQMLREEQEKERQSREEQKKMEKQEREKDRESTTSNIVQMSSSNQQINQGGQSSYEDEGPDEVGSVGLMLLNKSYFGAL